MNRKLYCVSLAVMALLPTLFAFFDDESYQYIADVSIKLNRLYNNHIIRTIPKNQPKPLQLEAQPQPPQLPTNVIVVSISRQGKFLEREIFQREGNFREGEILERENFQRGKIFRGRESKVREILGQGNFKGGKILRLRNSQVLNFLGFIKIHINSYKFI